MKITDLVSSQEDKELFNQLVGDALKKIIYKAFISQPDDAGASKQSHSIQSYQSRPISNPSHSKSARSDSKSKSIPYTPPPRPIPKRPLYRTPDKRSF